MNGKIDDEWESPDAGKIDGRRISWLDGIIDSMGMSLSKLPKIVKDREAWHAAVPGVTESDMTEQLNNNLIFK